MTILVAYGVPDLPPLRISEILTKLRVSHSIVGGFGRTKYMNIDGLSKAQPAWPVVVDRVTAIPKVRSFVSRSPLIYYVCDSRAALSETNVVVTPWGIGNECVRNVAKSLREATHKTKPCWTYERRDLAIMDYVNIASKPSFLNHIQSAIYKITPYALRKEVQGLCIAYLAGAEPLSKVKTKLKTSLKLEDLLKLMVSDKAKELREAVLLLRIRTVEEVAKETGYQTFELNYVSKSFSNSRTT